MDFPKYIYLVDWIDSAGQRSVWESLAGLEAYTPCRVVSIGFIVKETGDFITLANSMAVDTDDLSGGVCIAKSAVLKRKRIKV